jgi:septum formation inhibitor MinC
VETEQPEAEDTQLFGTETMAELHARQGKLGEAIRIYQRLLAGNPPADKVERWTERCRSLERARAHAPDLTLPQLAAPVRKPAAAPPAEVAAVTAVAPGAGLDDRDITVVEPAPAAAVTDVAAAAETGPVLAALAEPPHQLPMVITQPVRSGQVVYARKNDLIVLASVNPGGQVVADGNIHIYGALRGRAIAGVQGASDARIFCQKLEAELLAISGIYLIWDDIPKATLGKPAQVSLQGQACVVAPL